MCTSVEEQDSLLLQGNPSELEASVQGPPARQVKRELVRIQLNGTKPQLFKNIFTYVLRKINGENQNQGEFQNDHGEKNTFHIRLISTME